MTCSVKDMLFTTVVGFGLPDLVLDDYNQVSDERIERTGFLHQPFHYSFKDYAYAKHHHCDGHLLSDFIFRHNHVLCIVPPEHPELTQISICDEPIEKVEMLHNIPGFANWKNVETGAAISNSVFHLFKQGYADLLNTHGSVEKMRIEYSLLDLAEMMGFRTMEDVLRGVVLSVPESVQSLCEFAKLFTRKDIALSLRPMRYSFWR